MPRTVSEKVFLSGNSCSVSLAFSLFFYDEASLRSCLILEWWLRLVVEALWRLDPY